MDLAFTVETALTLRHGLYTRKNVKILSGIDSNKKKKEIGT
jgi:hypothetical protein